MASIPEDRKVFKEITNDDIWEILQTIRRDILNLKIRTYGLLGGLLACIVILVNKR